MLEVTTTFSVEPSRISDLLVGAFEGGSNLWVKSARLVQGNTSSAPWYGSEDFLYTPWCAEIGTYDDCNLLLNEKIVLTGLQMMADDYPDTHWNDFVSENDDADTADVFLQLCLFGGLVYG